MPEKQVYGTDFLRTNVQNLDEKTTWDYYNLIREIECSNYEKLLISSLEKSKFVEHSKANQKRKLLISKNYKNKT